MKNSILYNSFCILSSSVSEHVGPTFSTVCLPYIRPLNKLGLCVTSHVSYLSDLSGEKIWAFAQIELAEHWTVRNAALLRKALEMAT